MHENQQYRALDSILEEGLPQEIGSTFEYEPDVEGIAQQMKEGYAEVYGEEKVPFLQKIREFFSLTIAEQVQKPKTISDERSLLVGKLNYVVRTARKTLQKAGSSVSKMSELEQEIDSDIQAGKASFLSLREYIGRVDDGLEFVEEKIQNPENMEEENLLLAYKEQLIQKKESAEIELDHLAQKVELNFRSRDYLRENLRYASIESAAIERALLSAQQSAAILESTKDLAEYIKGGRLVAQLHEIFEKAGSLDSRMGEIMSQNLVSSSQLPSEFTLNADLIGKTNSQVYKKVETDRKQRIAEVSKKLGVA